MDRSASWDELVSSGALVNLPDHIDLAHGAADIARASPAKREEDQCVGLNLDAFAAFVRVSAGAIEKMTGFIGGDFASPNSGRASPNARLSAPTGFAAQENPRRM